MSHFTRSEFKCKCGSCDQDTVDFELLDILERLRVHYGVPITINSGNRCAAYNKKIGGSKNSQHVKSRAADIVVDGVHPHRVYALLDTAGNTAEWEQLHAKGSQTSWKDEFWTLVFAIPLIMGFIPGGEKYTKAGFTALSGMPEWYQYTLVTMVLASFGIKMTGTVKKLMGK